MLGQFSFWISLQMTTKLLNWWKIQSKNCSWILWFTIAMQLLFRLLELLERAKVFLWTTCWDICTQMWVHDTELEDNEFCLCHLLIFSTIHFNSSTNLYPTLTKKSTKPMLKTGLEVLTNPWLDFLGSLVQNEKQLESSSGPIFFFMTRQMEIKLLSFLWTLKDFSITTVPQLTTSEYFHWALWCLQFRWWTSSAQSRKVIWSTCRY